MNDFVSDRIAPLDRHVGRRAGGVRAAGDVVARDRRRGIAAGDRVVDADVVRRDEAEQERGAARRAHEVVGDEDVVLGGERHVDGVVALESRGCRRPRATAAQSTTRYSGQEPVGVVGDVDDAVRGDRHVDAVDGHRRAAEDDLRRALEAVGGRGVALERRVRQRQLQRRRPRFPRAGGAAPGSSTAKFTYGSTATRSRASRLGIGRRGRRLAEARRLDRVVDRVAELRARARRHSIRISSFVCNGPASTSPALNSDSLQGKFGRASQGPSLGALVVARRSAARARMPRAGSSPQ